MKLPTQSEVWQNAWVVPDAEQAALSWIEKFNIGPFFMGEFGDNILTDLVYRGQPGTLNIIVAVAHAGPIQIELIQRLDDKPNPYSDTVKPGETKFHHIGVWTNDMDADLEYYRQHDCEAAITGRVIDLQRFAYVDTQADLCCMVELVEHNEIFENTLNHMAGICSNWNGEDPIREFPQLG